MKNKSNTPAIHKLMALLLALAVLFSMPALTVSAADAATDGNAASVQEIELKVKGSGKGDVLINGEEIDKLTVEPGKDTTFTLDVTAAEGSYINGLVFCNESVIFEDNAHYEGTLTLKGDYTGEEAVLKVVFVKNSFSFFDSFLDFDLKVFQWIQSIQSPILNTIMTIITTLGDEGIIFIAMALVLMFTKKYRKAGFAMIIALLVMTLCNNVILKDLFARTRPFNLYIENPGKYAEWGGELSKYFFPNFVHAPSSYSFPSGHTSSAFAAAIAVLWYDRKLGIPTTVFAALMGFSRIFVEVHYCTDVIAGTIVGVIYALMGVLIVKYLYPVVDKFVFSKIEAFIKSKKEKKAA